MMTSKEALEKLNNFISREKHINSVRNKTINECVNIIKQDLEKLELIEALYNKSLKEMETIKNDDRELYLKYKALEKENQKLIINKNVAQAVAFDQKREIGELKDQISYLKEDGEEWQSAYEWSQTENSILKLKNQELEKENKELKKKLENNYNYDDETGWGTI